VPNMSKAFPIALLGSDLHLSHTCPVARMCEADWYEAMRRVLVFMSQWKQECDVPIILAGDIFHHYREPPELINFCIEHFPEMWAVPGQHDLPYHNIEHVHKSAYHTMCRVGRIHTLLPDEPAPLGVRSGGSIKRLVLHGFPWGAPLQGLNALPGEDGTYAIAVCHHYVWMRGHEHPGATQDTYYETLRGKLEGFQLAHFGDNHSPFYSPGADPYPGILNTGCLMRRRMDEAQHKPALCLLMSDGKVERLELPIGDECIAATPANPTTPQSSAVMDAAELMADLKDAGYVGTDFKLALRMTIQLNKDISEPCRRVLREVLKDGD
jgi:hypothetical protein